MSAAERSIRELAALADVAIDGDRPWDIRVRDPRLYPRLLREGSIALGESYMDGWWDADRLDELIFRLLRADLEHRIRPWKLLLPVLQARLINRQSRRRAYHIGRRHYDLGNDLYEAMLDRRLTYTCAYWKDASDLDRAQEAKLELVCRKIGLEAGMRVLDIGCGWGSFAGYAAENYGAEVTGVTVSREQVKWAAARYAGLPVTVELRDYRAVRGRFDRIVSLGMFEHVGPKNYRTYMQTVHRCLEEEGIFLLHTIGVDTPRKAVDPWIDRHIFPGAVLPTEAQIARAAQGLFVMEDWHNFGADYDPTLMAWMENVDRHWQDLDRRRYDERFYRMWRYFLLSNAGAFRARRSQLWQIVYTRHGQLGGYSSIR